jgi:hypothetical protein
MGQIFEILAKKLTTENLYLFILIFASFLHPNKFKFCRRKKNTEKKNEGTGYDNRADAY